MDTTWEKNGTDFLDFGFCMKTKQEMVSVLSSIVEQVRNITDLRLLAQI